jgi:hemerythrin-like metal-binding protein
MTPLPVTQTPSRTLPANFEIGIAELDAQHKRLHGLLERLRDAVGKHYGYATTAILDELAIETRIHFAVEESLMRMLSFPEVEIHVAEHQDPARPVGKVPQARTGLRGRRRPGRLHPAVAERPRRPLTTASSSTTSCVPASIPAPAPGHDKQAHRRDPR